MDKLQPPEEETQTVLIHFVQMEEYEVPKNIIDKGEEAICDYIGTKDPDSVKTRDWEIVDTNA